MMWEVRSTVASGSTARRNSISLEQAWGCLPATTRMAQLCSVMRNRRPGSFSQSAR